MPGLTSLSRSFFTNISDRKAPVVLRELDEKDNLVSNGSYSFQYFPETLTDTKAINYQPKDVPGGSLPIYQWTSSGERIISFTAYFTSDLDFSQNAQNLSASDMKSLALMKRNVDVRTAIHWLRRFLLPRYGAVNQIGSPVTFPPRKLILWIPNSGIGLAGGLDGQLGEVHRLHSLIALMTQCDVTYESFFPSGVPRIASVQLSFAQIGQVGGAVFFPQNSDFTDTILQTGITGELLPYPMRVKIS